MNPTTTVGPPIKPVPKRRWWLRGLLIGLALAIATPAALYFYSSTSTRNAWAAAEEEAGQDEPRWRLMEMEADRNHLADADNSALHVIATVRLGGRIYVSAAPNYEMIFEKLPPNAQLNTQQVQVIRTELTKIPNALESARKLKDMPEGRYPLLFSDDWIGTLIPHHQDARQIAEWMQHDAWLLAQEGDCDGAIESCQATINAGRSMKDDPFLISCLIRLAMQNIALNTLERVLAQGEPSEAHLLAMQTMLEKEIAQGTFLPGVRGERGGSHYLFENIRAGKTKLDFLRMMGPGSTTGLDPVSEWFSLTFPSTLMKHYPEYLHHMNRTVAAAKLPLHERGPRLAALEAEVRQTKNPVLRLLAPGLGKVEKVDRRTQANLRCMVVILACERYRQKNDDKRWPTKLDDLVKAKLLDALPADPLDNQPLRYRRTNEGVVVYSVGFDLKDDLGNINHEQPMADGVDLGFRLWDADLRRRAPLPPVGLPATP